jgi:hypothetical protein
MKAFAILMTLTCISLYAPAQCDRSVLVIHNTNNLPMKVYVDGSTGRNGPTPGVTVRGIPPGEHTVKVVAVYTDDNGNTQRYNMFNGRVNFRGSRYMDAWVEEGKGISIHETPEPCDGELPEGTEPPINPNAPGYAHHDQPAPSADQPAPSDGQPSFAAHQPDQQAPAAAPLPTHISDADFAQMKNTIAATKYETKKMDTLKVLSGNTNFTTAQVGELMGLFAFESNKLQVAEMLYMFTVDRANYPSLASNFNFDARKEDFKKFLDGK